MPTMIRPKDKSQRIAYKILGIPLNIAHKPTKRERYINRHLLSQEAHKVR